MEKVINVSLDQRQAQRLQSLALRYGLSLKELTQRILTEVANETPEEQLSDYVSPRGLARALKTAFQDIKQGRLSKAL